MKRDGMTWNSVGPKAAADTASAAPVQSDAGSQSPIASGRRVGTVKWFNDEKGFGFITQQSGPDVFVYYAAIQDVGYRTLDAGDLVEFEIAQGPKGLQAANVRKVSRS